MMEIKDSLLYMETCLNLHGESTNVMHNSLFVVFLHIRMKHLLLIVLYFHASIHLYMRYINEMSYP